MSFCPYSTIIQGKPADFYPSVLNSAIKCELLNLKIPVEHCYIAGATYIQGCSRFWHVKAHRRGFILYWSFVFLHLTD